MPTKEPKLGDLVEVFWRDVQGDEAGVAADARPATRCTPGYFAGWSDLGSASPYLVTHKTKDLDTSTTNTGWDAYPAANVLRVIVLRRVAWYRKWHDIITGGHDATTHSTET